MEFVALFMVFFGFFGFIICLVWLIIKAINGGEKKPALLGLLVCVVLFFTGPFLSPDFGTEKNNETASAIETPEQTSKVESEKSATKYPKKANTTIVERASMPTEDTVESEDVANDGETPPSSAPTPTPTSTPTPAPTSTPTPEPVQAQVPASTPAPVQSGGKTISNGDGTYTHDFSGGRVLITTESNNGDDPVYHIKDCRAAKKIPPESEGWYDSAQAAINDGRRICGYCD